MNRSRHTVSLHILNFVLRKAHLRAGLVLRGTGLVCRRVIAFGDVLDATLTHWAHWV